MRSKNLSQLDLIDPVPQTEPCDVSLAHVLRRKSIGEAMMLSQDVSGLSDKQVYLHLDIDPSLYSRIKRGTAHFPNDERWLNFLNLTSNDIPLMWQIEKRGYDWTTLRRHRSSVEADNERLRQQLADTERALKLLVEAHRK